MALKIVARALVWAGVLRQSVGLDSRYCSTIFQSTAFTALENSSGIASIVLCPCANCVIGPRSTFNVYFWLISTTPNT